MLLALMAVSEALSATHHYRPVPLMAVGLTVSAVAASVTAAVGDTGALVRAIRERRWIAPEVVLISVLGAVGALLLLTGFATAPNNPDSLSYHLPRIMQWFQNGSFASFETPYPAQVYLPPGAEQAQAFLLAATGSDHAMFLAQWCAWLAVGTAVHACARGLGAGRVPSMVGASVAMTAPLVVGEAATTQNDLIATALVMTSLAALVRSAIPDRQGPTAGAVAISVLLLAATAAVKPVVALFGLPVAVLVAVRVARRPTRASVATLLAASVVGAAANIPWMMRNQAEYGRALGPDLSLTVEDSHLSAAASNSVKNLGHNLAVPGPGVVNDVIQRALGETSSAVSGVSPDEPAFSYTPFDVDSQRNEDRAANLLQMVLGAAGLVTVLASARLRRRFLPVVVVAATGYVLFSATVRYQAFGGRFMLPLVPLFAVLVAGSIEALPRWRRSAAVLVVAACLVQAAPWLLAQKWRPLVGSDSVITREDREDLTVSLEPADRAKVAATVADVERWNPHSIGLVGKGAYAHEYVWWRLLASGGNRRLSHLPPTDRGRADVVVAPWVTRVEGPPGFVPSGGGGYPVLVRPPK